MLRLEQQDDLRRHVRDARFGETDYLVVGKPDPRVTTTDPLLSFVRIAEDVQVVLTGVGIAKPGLKVFVKSTARKWPATTGTDDVELELAERGAKQWEVIPRHADLDIVVRSRLSTSEEVNGPSSYDVPPGRRPRES